MEGHSRRAALSGLAAALAAGGARAQGPGAPLGEAAIRTLLSDFVDVRRQSLGVVVGVVGPEGRRVISHGVLSRTDPRPVGPTTVFGIASMTKSFTGLLLAEAVRRGEVALDDPLSRYLPPEVTVPERGGRKITLLDLATHTAGLPASPPATSLGEPARDAAEPWAPLHAALGAIKLTYDIGAVWIYTNMGYALLGEALSRRAGLSYPELVRRRILGPLGLRDTGFSPTRAMAARRAPGHLATLEPAPDDRRAWTLPSGGLLSTVSDLMTYAAAYAGLSPTPLAAAMAATRATTRPSPLFGGDYGFGWVVLRNLGAPVVVHGGLGGGYASCVAFDPAARNAVVVLSNAAPEIQTLGVRILRPGVRSQAQGSSSALERLMGTYVLDADLATQRLTKGGEVAILRRPTGVALSLPGLPPGLLSARPDGSFALQGFPVAVVFDAGDGPAAGLTLTIAGQSAHASRRP